MARYLGPSCKLARREGSDLELKSGIKSFELKCKSKTLPGTGHGARLRGRPSDYQIHLRAKQRMRRYYGVLEKQFRRYYKNAAAARGDTGEMLMSLLESRLDNIVYRMGFATTRSQARQLVSHKHVLVDDLRVNIPSYLVRENQAVSIAKQARTQAQIKDAISQAEVRATEHNWIDVNFASFSGKVVGVPDLADLGFKFDISLVVEHYSK